MKMTRLKAWIARLLVALRLRKATPPVTAKEVHDDLLAHQREAIDNLKLVRQTNIQIASSFESAANAKTRQAQRDMRHAGRHRVEADQADALHLALQNSAVELATEPTRSSSSSCTASRDTSYSPASSSSSYDCGSTSDSGSSSSSYSE